MKPTKLRKPRDLREIEKGLPIRRFNNDLKYLDGVYKGDFRNALVEAFNCSVLAAKMCGDSLRTRGEQMQRLDALRYSTFSLPNINRHIGLPEREQEPIEGWVFPTSADFEYLSKAPIPTLEDVKNACRLQIKQTLGIDGFGTDLNNRRFTTFGRIDEVMPDVKNIEDGGKEL